MSKQRPDAASVDPDKRPLIIRLGKRLRPLMDALVVAGSTVSKDATLPRSEFPWIEPIAAAWRDIASEAMQVCRRTRAVPPLREISPDHARIAADGLWRSYFLNGYGFEIKENRRRCPLTARLVDQVPGLNSAFFSILTPGAHIPSHRGVTKGLLTCHLGLSVPDGTGCRMEIDGSVIQWAEGEAVFFDDTYRHEVWNATDQTRIILLIQFERPMRFLARIVSRLFLFGIRRSAFVKDARRNLTTWEEAFSGAERG